MLECLSKHPPVASNKKDCLRWRYTRICTAVKHLMVKRFISFRCLDSVFLLIPNITKHHHFAVPRRIINSKTLKRFSFSVTGYSFLYDRTHLDSKSGVRIETLGKPENVSFSYEWHKILLKIKKLKKV